MRLKLLVLSLLMAGGILQAQDVTTLVITEARYGRQSNNYIELTNMGDVALDLNDFFFGAFHPWTNERWSLAESFNIGQFIKDYKIDLDTLIQPKESIWIAQVDDYQRKMHILKPDQYGEKSCPDEHWNADIIFHKQEAPNPIPSDSITPGWPIIDLWGGRDIWFLANYPNDTDTIIVDQIGGVFDESNGTNYDQSYPVAGITAATATHTLIRKFGVKHGNEEFVYGNDITDSEWLPIPPLNADAGNLQYRRMFWTVGNHGNYTLDATTLVSSDLNIKYNEGIIEVPWGIHNDDSIMSHIDYTPGVAWHYDLNTDVVGGANWEQAFNDSAYISVRTGDTLTIYVAGESLAVKKFRLEVLAPTDDANWIIPMARKNYSTNTWPGHPGPAYRVTQNLAMDTIFEVPFAERTDSILKYFEKAPDASWEFVFVDGVAERPDVKEGDILRVTAKDASTKDYYIKVRDYRPSHLAELSSITWPDAPSIITQVGIFGWSGDTIPGFSPGTRDYKIKIPYETVGIPSLLAKARNLNAKIEVQRAKTLYGSVEDATVKFTVTAEDDTTVWFYNVEINKDKPEELVQPWDGEPFFSQYVWQDNWNNHYLEITNPTPGTIDMSNYMFMGQWNEDWKTVLSWDNAASEWLTRRYVKYIPGYRWVDSTDWVNGMERFVVNDIENVNPMLGAGEQFVMGWTNSAHDAYNGYPWTPDIPGVVDIDFKRNPWNENIAASPINQWQGFTMYMLKIVGDSIHEGWKAATDPEDFELLEVFGGNGWNIDGEDANAGNQRVTFIRKPEIYKPNATVAGSFADNKEDSEWIRHDAREGVAAGLPWPRSELYITESLNKHFMYTPTVYKSTVSSQVYLVTDGYSMEEEIKGLVTGVTVSDFLANLIKANENQTLIVRTNGVELASDAVVSNGDSLIVKSEDLVNTSRYHLVVTADGLSSDAVLLSETYTIVSASPASVGGFDYGTKLKDIVAGVTLPAGARLDIIDAEGKYVATKMRNFDTLWVDVLATDDIFFEVIAEDGVTSISYQLIPSAEASDAFVLSSLYDVNQETALITLIPSGTTVPVFLSNLVPATGATLQMVDKLDFDRNEGYIYMDDKLVVTSSDGNTVMIYYLALLEKEPDYLSYVTSTEYLVDQNELTIDGGEDLNDRSLVSDVLGNLVPASGATMTMMTSDMVAKAGADMMTVGDVLEVMAANGVNVTYYDINVTLTSARSLLLSDISIYPNPSNGTVNIDGLEAGSRIQIYNSLGTLVYNKVVVNTYEVLTLENQGLYFMTISDKAGVKGFHKLIVE